jgi:flagellar hook-associated protein 2
VTFGGCGESRTRACDAVEQCAVFAEHQESVMATFNAGGLASGIDTNTLVDSLVKIRALSVDLLKSRQGAYTTQVSAVGDIVNRLNGLDTATKALGTGGLLGVGISGTYKGMTVTATSSAQMGRFNVDVVSLATAAQQRSKGYNFGATLNGGRVDVGVNGATTSVTLTNGMTLADAAAAINSQVSAVTATVLTSGSQQYLSITNKDAGFTIGGTATNALTLSGAGANQFNFTRTVTATNAHVTIDGLDFERRTNTINDALSGVTMTLTQAGQGAGELVLASDATATSKTLQGFVESYNLLLKSLQKNIAVTSTTDRSTTLAGDASLKSLQRALQGLTSQAVGTGNVRTLADLGVKTARDGSLSIDATVLGKAIAADPAAVNAIFTTATTGIAAATTALAQAYTNSTDGILTVRTKSIQGRITQLGKDITKQEAGLERYRDLLIAQFTAMEKVVAQLKSAGNYLTQQSALDSEG